jgi:hypothetical protein
VSDFDNLVGRLLPLVGQGGWYWNEQGKFVRHPVGPAVETPWIYHNMTFQCVKWHEVFFEHASGKKMVHSHCQQCYKVVIRPRTLEELVALENWQQTLLGVECKCGIELRDFVNRKHLYGGYFYNRGVEAGRMCYEQVKRWANDMHTYQDQFFEVLHDEPMPVLLKLGCSEFERAIGPSDTYTITDEQRALEAALDDLMDFDPFAPEGKEFPQPDVLKEYVRTCWLRWAHHHGDMTYLKFMPDGKPFSETPAYYTPPVATYHEED